MAYTHTHTNTHTHTHTHAHIELRFIIKKIAFFKWCITTSYKALLELCCTVYSMTLLDNEFSVALA